MLKTSIYMVLQGFSTFILYYQEILKMYEEMPSIDPGACSKSSDENKK